MTSEAKLLACAIVSVVVHLAIARGLDQLPPIEPRKPTRPIEVRVVDPPPEPPKPEPPEPAKLEPPKSEVEAPKLAELPRPRPRPTRVQTIAPKEVAAPEHAVIQDGPPGGEVYTAPPLESTSSTGGPAVATGSAGGSAAKPGSAAPGAGAGAPVAAFEATKLPLPQGRCFGKYTDDARAAGVEGTVVLDLIVGEDGRARDVKVVTGLGHGLTEAAIAALRACTFSPGEKDGKRVAVRVRGFKIRFVLQTAE